MPFELKLAIKYFCSRRKSLVRFTSIVAVVGIAAGVASLIIASAISKGFSDEIKSKVLGNTAHIAVYLEGETRFSNWKILQKKIEQIENLSTIEPTTYESVVLLSKKDSSYGVLRVQNAEFRVQSSEFRVEISIGKELAEKLQLKVGDKSNIITLEDNNIPRKSQVFIGDVFETGLYEYDSTWIYLDEANYLKLKDLDGFSPRVFNISVKDIYKADATADSIRQVLGSEFKVIDWQEANKPLFAALSLERKVAFAIILLVILIAGLNITTTLSLLVNERKLDIAILRTCGAKTKSLVTIFMFEGIILSLLGIIFGVVIGLLGCFIGNYFRIISLSKEVYSLNYIPFHIDFVTLFVISFVTFLLSMVAILYPSIKASRIKPTDNLRMK